MARLGDVCKINMGQSPDSASYNQSQEGLPFYQGNADFGEVHPITKYWCSRPLKIAEKDDILISVRAPIGAINIAKENCCIGRGLASLTAIKKICNSKYLRYALFARRTDLISKGTGSTFKAVNKAVLNETQIPLPSLYDQHKIANIFDKICELIALRKQQLSKLDKLVKSRFMEMFGDIPTDKYMAIEGLCVIITDGTHQPPKFVRSGIPFLFVSNISSNEITYDSEIFISEATYSELIKRTPIEIGDVLLSTVGSYGHSAVVNSSRRFCFQRHIAYLKPRKDLINSDYLRGALLSDEGQRQIEARVKGIAQKTLNLSEIRKIRLPLPQMDKQSRFADFVFQVDKSKLEVQDSLGKLETLKNVLMQKYFG